MTLIAEFDFVPGRVKIDCYCDYTLDKAYPLPSIYVYLQLNDDANVRELVTPCGFVDLLTGAH